MGKKFLLDSLLGLFVFGQGFLLESHPSVFAFGSSVLRVVVLGRRSSLDSLLAGFRVGEKILFGFIPQIFVLGQRFVLESLVRAVLFSYGSCWIHSGFSLWQKLAGFTP